MNPLLMVWNKDNYYIVCFRDDKEGTANYRIDRMENVIMEEENITVKKEFENFNIEKYRKQVFSMFGGELKHIELQFNFELLDEIYDKFGEDIQVIKVAEDMYKCNVQIQISPTFFSWLAGTRGKVKILTPNTVREQFEEFVREISKVYI